jgi:hypothetical protein
VEEGQLLLWQEAAQASLIPLHLYYTFKELSFFRKPDYHMHTMVMPAFSDFKSIALVWEGSKEEDFYATAW